MTKMNSGSKNYTRFRAFLFFSMIHYYYYSFHYYLFIYLFIMLKHNVSAFSNSSLRMYGINILVTCSLIIHAKLKINSVHVC